MNTSTKTHPKNFCQLLWQKKKWIAAILLILTMTESLLKTNECHGAEVSGKNKTTIQENELHAQAAVLMDARSGRVLYSKNGDEQRAMASTTKIMTCILTLENAELSELVEVSGYAASMPDVQLNIKKGEQYKLEDLLYSLMLESHNDSAVAIAEHIGGSVEGFAALMNQKARDLGCDLTYFVTPNGLDGTADITQKDGQCITKKHSTTAKELARIMAYCILESPKREQFLKITQAKSWQFQNAEGNRSFSCNNHNAFFSMMEGVLSGKTGFTCDAGYCYVGAVENNGRYYTAAVLGSGWPPNKKWKWSDMKKLMAYGLENYNNQNIYEDTMLQPITVENGIEEQVFLSKEKRQINILLSEDDAVKVEQKLPGKVMAPVKAGTVMGYENYYINGELYQNIPIKAVYSVDLWDYTYCLRKILARYFLRKNEIMASLSQNSMLYF